MPKYLVTLYGHAVVRHSVEVLAESPEAAESVALGDDELGEILDADYTVEETLDLDYVERVREV